MENIQIFKPEDSSLEYYVTVQEDCKITNITRNNTEAVSDTAFIVIMIFAVAFVSYIAGNIFKN